MTNEVHYDYTPVMPSELWAQVRTFVQDAVRTAAPQTPYSEKDLYPVTAKFARWAVDTAFLPLNADVLFDAATVDEFVHAGLAAYTPSGRATMRSKLRAVARALATNSDADEHFSIRRSSPVTPYSGADLAALETWARGQHSEDRRTSAGALLALGLGAGLTGREIMDARHDDVVRLGDIVVVHVRGSTAREVPVLRTWEQLLLERADGHRGWLFRAGQRGGNPNLITDFVSRSHQQVPLQARRMRATWLIHHLTVGTPLPLLLTAAGLQSAEALDRLMPFVPVPEPLTARTLLR